MPGWRRPVYGAQAQPPQTHVIHTLIVDTLNPMAASAITTERVRSPAAYVVRDERGCKAVVPSPNEKSAVKANPSAQDRPR